MSDETSEDHRFTERAIEAFIRIALIAILAAWCFEIVRPFLVPLIWGVIIGVAAFPGYRRLSNALKGRTGTAAVIFVVLALTATADPGLPAQPVGGGRGPGPGARFRRGPPADSSPAELGAGAPAGGGRLHRSWSQASVNLESGLGRFLPQIQAALRWLVGAAAGAGFGILQFVFAIGIAGVLLAHAERGTHAATLRSDDGWPGPRVWSLFSSVRRRCAVSPEGSWVWR